MEREGPAAPSESSAADLDHRLWQPRNAARATAGARGRFGSISAVLAVTRLRAQRLAARPVGAWISQMAFLLDPQRWLPPNAEATSSVEMIPTG
jgi:hypothetical protein